MSVCNEIKSFLKTKLNEHNLKRVNVARDTGIASYTIHSLFNGSQNDVTLKTILRLADYFKCTIDEVLGREKFKVTERVKFKPVDPQASMEKIKDFIEVKMNETGLDVTNLARSCGLARGALRGFIEGNERHQTLKSNSILAIADTFNISIDELIGRTEVNPSLLKSKERADTPSTKPEASGSVLKNLSAQSADDAKNIQKFLKSFQSPVDHKINVNNLHNHEVKKPSHSK